MLGNVLDYLPGIGVAVVTALLTTVILEYIAKPRLEARKARLIRDRQQIDEVIFGFQRIGLALGSIAPADHLPSGNLMREIHQRQVVALGPLIEQLSVSIARLPVSYAHKHGEHIAMTSKFLGFAWSRPEIAAQGEYVPDAWIRQIADDMPRFDTYFVVHVDFHDSQEPLIKRLFWKWFTAKQYRADAVATLEAHYGGAPRPRDDQP